MKTIKSFLTQLFTIECNNSDTRIIKDYGYNQFMGL